jgi:AhpD family alkylhydroperoxidase
MTQRFNPMNSPATFSLIKSLIDYGQSVQKAGLEPNLMRLVEIRASQINGCAMCLAYHTADARQQGETEERIYLLGGWRESSLYSAREKAALEWTEALTRLSETGAPDAAYQAMRAQFSDEESVKLTLMIGVINTFNRIGVGFAVDPARIRMAA